MGETSFRQMFTRHGCLYGALMYMPTVETSSVTEGSTIVWRSQRTPENSEKALWKNFLMGWILTEKWKSDMQEQE